jgi:hypothetical protein
MLGLRFSANWKRGVKMRPVKAFRELTASESQPPDFAVSLNARQCWIYEFAVEDTNVPLSDHLILYIFSPENKRLARLSARKTDTCGINQLSTLGEWVCEIAAFSLRFVTASCRFVDLPDALNLR